MKRIIMILDFSEHRNIACCLLATATVFIFFIFFLLLTVTKTLGQEKKETEVTSQTITSIKDKLKHIENRIVEIRKTDWFKLLNDQQKKYVLWDERIFSYAYNPKNYEIGNDRDTFEKRWVEQLEKSEPGYPGDRTLSAYDQAILGLAIIKSNRAAELLLKISTEKAVKDNAHRHFATKALGILGDLSVVPELIPLVYHYNFNTRWDAQVSLVRLTGQNFGTDAEAWGKWYNENREKIVQKTGKELPVFNFTRVDWTFGSDDLELQIWSLPETQKKEDDHFFKDLSGFDSPDSETPKIIKMEPENGAAEVDAATVKELRVTFDRDMQGGFSWVTYNGAMFPKSNRAKWIDKRTCVLPVELESGKSYLIGINSLEYTNFRSKDDVPAIPVLYQFSTAGTIQEKK